MVAYLAADAVASVLFGAMAGLLVLIALCIWLSSLKRIHERSQLALFQRRTLRIMALQVGGVSLVPGGIAMALWPRPYDEQWALTAGLLVSIGLLMVPLSLVCFLVLYRRADFTRDNLAAIMQKMHEPAPPHLPDN